MHHIFLYFHSNNMKAGEISDIYEVEEGREKIEKLLCKTSNAQGGFCTIK